MSSIPSQSSGTPSSAGKKRVLQREDASVTDLRGEWQQYVMKIIQTAVFSKAAVPKMKENSPVSTAHDPKLKAQEVAQKHLELTRAVSKMESVVRGKEEEVKGLVLDRASAGSVGRRRKKLKSEKAQNNSTTKAFDDDSDSDAENIASEPNLRS